MGRPQSPVTLELDPADADRLGAAVAAANRCLDELHGFVGAVVSRPATVRVSVDAETDSSELPYALMLAALDAVEAAGRQWPHEKPQRLWRGKTQDGYATDRALESLAPGEMLLLAQPGDDNGDTVDDYLEERLTQAGIAETAHRDAGTGIVAWVLTTP